MKSNILKKSKKQLGGLKCPGRILPVCFTDMVVVRYFFWRKHGEWLSIAWPVTHIKGRLLDKAVILFNCVPFQNGNFS